ncbi:MAG TPA: BamA/TamA family outer membrane protein [Kofleriaceae bacterium]|nr:BamA/TamA family outer membrane protein [Kofleriaceae bacterium]
MRRRSSWQWVAAFLAIPCLAVAEPDVTVDKDRETAGSSNREIGLLPLVGGDTDIGIGVGAIGSVAMFDAAHHPYRWQVQFSAFVATKTGPTSPSYEDTYAQLTIPQLMHGRLRVELRPSFTRDTTLPFYGIGNAIRAQGETVPQRDFYQRIHPAMQALSRWTIYPNWSVLLGGQYIYNRTETAVDSTLAMNLDAIDPNARRPHSLLKLETGLVYDSRDSEVSPSRGMYHQVTIRVSPGMGEAFPYEYEQVTATARFYTTLIPKRMILAIRGVYDQQFGDVPFYELSRYEDTSAIGGGMAVRGVPAYELYGRIKAFGNIELRTAITRFEWLDRKFKLGFATFVDAGRLWTGMANPQPMLEGSGIGLHYGLGGGIRLQQGQAFVVRADIAWSPDARPVGGYVMADEIF